MKGMGCNESYTLLYYISNKQSDFNRQKMHTAPFNDKAVCINQCSLLH